MAKRLFMARVVVTEYSHTHEAQSPYAVINGSHHEHAEEARAASRELAFLLWDSTYRSVGLCTPVIEGITQYDEAPDLEDPFYATYLPL
jgi:hypothetical protein